MSIHALLMSLSERPFLVLAVVFAACTESFAAIGTFVPTGVGMFVAGALMGAGAVNAWLTRRQAHCASPVLRALAGPRRPHTSRSVSCSYQTAVS
jgi:membrane protein DedA with SNARE-associated domain